jgi:hypothetical protein
MHTIPLRHWNLYRKQYIDEKQTKCTKCDELAIGDGYDKDWNRVSLCEKCFDGLRMIIEQ